MRQLFLLTTITLPLCLAQQAAPARAGAAPAGRGGGNSNLPSIISIRENPANQEVGVDIDRFIGFPTRAFSRTFNGMLTRAMLTHGDPYHPGPNGAVLEYRDEAAVATLEPHSESASIESPQIYFYYVQAGAGTVDSGPGTEKYELHNGVGVLLAPGTKQHFVNTGDTQLSMIMVSWKDNDGLTVKAPIKVVDTLKKPFGANNNPNGVRVHWVMAGKSLFNADDGINTSLSAIYIPPMSYTGPHAHIPGVEEMWIKVGTDMNYALLGSEIREVVGNAAFLSPPNSKTTHSQMNPSRDNPSIWLFVSHRFTEKNVHPPEPATAK